MQDWKTGHRHPQPRDPVPRSVPLARLLCTLALALLLTDQQASAQDCRPPLVERQRFGFVAASAGWSQRFNVHQLGAGWYVDFTHSTPPSQGPDRALAATYRVFLPFVTHQWLAGLDRALVVRTYEGQSLDPEWLGPLVDRNPGAIWLIGNEPDCIWQDRLYPEEYARIYHDLYSFIKNRDRTSRVAAGGIVQPTPLRLEYLDRVLSAYQASYERELPVDVWHIHNAILNEQRGGWGAGIPPGISADSGTIRSIDDNDNMAIFQEQTWAFRQWMADRGYAGYPLIVTEYGILMPDDYGFDVNRVNAFMSATFRFFQTATDAELGDPSDGGRLVQRWAWFSLDVPPWDPVTGVGFNGNLFDPETTAMTPFGQHFRALTGSFPPLSYVDLGVAAWQVVPVSAGASSTQTITQLLEIRVVNGGTDESGTFTVSIGYDGPVDGNSAQLVTNLLPSEGHWLTFSLADLEPGSYALSISVDAKNQVIESAECNNQVDGTFVAPEDQANLRSGEDYGGSGLGVDSGPAQPEADPESAE